MKSVRLDTSLCNSVPLSILFVMIIRNCLLSNSGTQDFTDYSRVSRFKKYTVKRGEGGITGQNFF